MLPFNRCVRNCSTYSSLVKQVEVQLSYSGVYNIVHDWFIKIRCQYLNKWFTHTPLKLTPKSSLLTGTFKHFNHTSLSNVLTHTFKQLYLTPIPRFVNPYI